MNSVSLAPVVKILEEKCVHCYACVAACPQKYCMDGSGEVLLINHDVCIGCGNCIVVCTHNARKEIDDTDAFFEDLKRGEKIVTIVAPAIVSVFPKDYLRLNGYLESLGVKAAFDVSFGAELTVVSYLDFIKKKEPKLVFAQPCPAIVNFIQINHPELIPYLAPADSPMLHTIKMIREYYPEFKNHKVAVISPCIAKKREFQETGLGDYNVTMIALKERFEKQNVELSKFSSVDYKSAPAERAVSFSTPGGLLDTAERFMPGIRRLTRKIEGPHAIYPYIKSVASCINDPEITFPLLIDCLNCEFGCNGGPGTGNNHKNQDEIESHIRKRSAELEKKINPKKQDSIYKKFNKKLKRFWKPGLYDRSYRNYSENFSIQYPNDKELAAVYENMKKSIPKDIIDCTACGYGSCNSMATAIFNKLNKPSNCAHYNLSLLDEEKKTTIYINNQLNGHINRALEIIESINTLVENLNNKINIQSTSVTSSSEVTGEMIESLKSTSNLSRQKREAVQEMIMNASRGQEAMKETVEAVQGISQSIDGIGAAIKIISVIASNTNLLSMNAAIEAAHAGDAGKGFAVVADEIRRLSESTRQNSRTISQTLSDIIAGITTTSKRSTDAGYLINNMAHEINSFATVMSELIDTLTELSVKSSDITVSLDTLKEHSSSVKTDYTQMLSLTDKIRYDINFLAAMSADIVRTMEKKG
jgi:iron only hydrogenase large subunit-like protein